MKTFTTTAGQLCPVLTAEEARAAGLQELTLPVRIMGERDVLADIAANFMGARFAWCVVPCSHRLPNGSVFPAVSFWRANLNAS